MKKKIIAFCMLAAIAAAPVCTSVMSASTIETTAEQTVTLSGEKSIGRGGKTRTKCQATVYIDENDNVYVTLRGQRYTAYSIGGNQYAFTGNDGYYYTFYL